MPALKFEDLLITGIYTVYDNLTLLETGAVVNMENHPSVKAIFQWQITGNTPESTQGNLIKCRVFSVRTGKWSNWESVPNAPVPDQPQPINPGPDPGDGLWENYLFLEYTLPGVGKRYIAVDRKNNQQLTKPTFATHAHVDYATDFPDPATIKVCTLMLSPDDGRYYWETIVRDSSGNNTLEVVRSYMVDDHRQSAIITTVDAPDEPPSPNINYEWRRAVEDISLPHTGIFLNDKIKKDEFFWMNWVDEVLWEPPKAYFECKTRMADPDERRTFELMMKNKSSSVTQPSVPITNP